MHFQKNSHWKQAYLICTVARRNKACSNTTIRYDYFENIFFKLFTEFNFSSLFSAKSSTIRIQSIDNQIQPLLPAINEISRKITAQSSLLNMLGEESIVEISTAISSLNNEKKKLSLKLNELKFKKENQQTESNLQEAFNLYKHIRKNEDYEKRYKIHQTLARLLSVVVADGKTNQCYAVLNMPEFKEVMLSSFKIINNQVVFEHHPDDFDGHFALLISSDRATNTTVNKSEKLPVNKIRDFLALEHHDKLKNNESIKIINKKIIGDEINLLPSASFGEYLAQLANEEVYKLYKGEPSYISIEGELDVGLLFNRKDIFVFPKLFKIPPLPTKDELHDSWGCKSPEFAWLIDNDYWFKYADFVNDGNQKETDKLIALALSNI